MIASECHLLKIKSVHNLLISKITKAYYKHTNYLLGRNNRHDILIKDINSSEYISDKTSCNKFREYFASVFKSNNNIIANFLPRYNLKDSLNNSTKQYKTQESTKQFEEFLKKNRKLIIISN